MVIGIRFEVPNKYGDLLHQILDKYSVENYFWEIDNDEVYIPESRRFVSLFDNKNYSGQEFKKLILTPNYYTIFVRLLALPLNGTAQVIDTYEDFINSDYQLILFVVDNVYVDIYVKKKSDIELLKDNAETRGFTDIQLITADNDLFKDGLHI